MAEDEACDLLRRWPGDGGLEAWSADRCWKMRPGNVELLTAAAGQSWLDVSSWNGLPASSITAKGQPE